MAARIVLLGATGHTGGRTAQALVARGARPVLAGRDAARLAPLADRLGGDAGPLETATADVTDAGSLQDLVGRGDVLVTTVGPFLRLGEPAVAAATDAGAVYLDSTGEPPFLRRVFEEFGPRAQRSGAALLPAFGHDYVPGVLAGALALAEAGDRVHRVDIGYSLDSGPGQGFSRGTLVSLLGVLLEPGFAWHEGRLAEAAGRRAGVAVRRRGPYPARAVGRRFGAPDPARPGAHAARGGRLPGLVRPGHHRSAHRLAPATPWLARLPGAAAA